ncbi:MAG: poly-gamma-glutamate hydrolase family protein [Acidimicrobiales bacterium]
MPSAPSPDRSESRFARLLAHAGVQEVVERRGTFGFMAFHGGNLEAVTDVVASAAARAGNCSLYGVLQPSDLRWHIPSSAVSPVDSVPLAQFLDHVEVAVAVHGYGRADHWATLLAGGSNRRLAAHVADHLRAALPGYEIIDELDAIPAALRGVHPANPVNLPRGGGVQLELPPRVRGIGPFWDDHPYRRTGQLCPDTEALIRALTAAAQTWPTESTDEMA